MPESQGAAAHKCHVTESILAAATRVVADDGLLSVSMSRIACEAGVSRTTLYNYFSNVAEVVSAWHERNVADHAVHLRRASERAGTPGQRLRNVLTAYSEITSRSDEGAIAAVVHLRRAGQRQVKYDAQQLRDIVLPLVASAQHVGELRDDISPDDLTTLCLHALSGPSQSSSAARRLVDVAMDVFSSPRDQDQSGVRLADPRS